MPRGGQFGYLFTSEIERAKQAITAAHELGHGRWKLYHPFDKHYGGFAQAQTDNVMDYANGSHLAKWQWDLIHDPAMLVSIFESDDKSETESIAPNKLSIFVCDSLTQNGKVYYKGARDCKLQVMLERKDTSIVRALVKLVIAISDTKSKLEKSYTITSFGEKQQLAVDSLPDGKYEITVTFGTAIVKQNFFYRKNKCAYACKVCGRDLTVTEERLKAFFSGNRDISIQDAAWFNEGLKKADFNTCKKQVHFFSQISAETGGFKKFVEDLSYRPHIFLETFNENCNLKSFFNQSFWTNKIYKKYFAYEVYEFDTLSSGTHYKESSLIKYRWAPDVTPPQETYCVGVIKHTSDTIKIPTVFTPAGNNSIGKYRKVAFTQIQKDNNQKLLMSITYANRMGNGDSTTHDGYNFRGRGAVHLTGRGTYRDVSKRANNLFGTNFDWETNYLSVTTDRKSIIFSAVAFFSWKMIQTRNTLEFLQNNDCKAVTIKVNGKNNGLDNRKKAFNKLLDTNLFDCIINQE